MNPKKKKMTESTLFNIVLVSFNNSYWMNYLFKIYVYSLLIPVLLFFAFYFAFKLTPSPDATFFQNIIIGHRGCRVKGIPENSFQSMEYANKGNVEGVEFDLQVTKDNNLVVMHDSTVERSLKLSNVTNNPYKGNERIDKLTLRDLQKYFIYRDRPNETVPTLKDMVEHINKINPKLKILIELKSWSNNNKMIKKIVKFFDEYKLYNRAVIGSFNPFVLYYIRLSEPKIVTLLFTMGDMLSTVFGNKSLEPKFLSEMNPSIKILLEKSSKVIDYIILLSYQTWLPPFLGVGVIGIENGVIQSGYFHVETIQKRGYVVNSWVVNEKIDKMVYLTTNVTITTDYLFDD